MSVTVKKLREQLKPFVEQLAQAHAALDAEVKTTAAAVQALESQYTAQIQPFLEKVIPALSGPAFERFDGLTTGFKQTTNGQIDGPRNTALLGSYRQQLLQQRAAALATVAGVTDEPITLENFSGRLTQGKPTGRPLTPKKRKPPNRRRRARKNKKDWEVSPSYQYYALDQELLAREKPGFSKENQRYYDTQS